MISILILLLIFPNYVFAEGEKVADLKKGQKAPFSGVLMSEGLASKLYLDSKFSPKQCDIKIEEKISESILTCDRKLKILDSKLDIQKEKFSTIIKLKDNRIDFLEERWSPSPWYESGEFWFSVGLFSGIILTAVAGYALGQASN